MRRGTGIGLGVALVASLACVAGAGAATFRETTGGGSSSPDVAAPTFTRPPAFSPTHFHNHAERGTAASYLVFTISEAAELRLHFSRSRPGRIVHGLCAAPSHANSSKRHCIRWVGTGTTSGHALAGDDKIPFSPRIDGHLLTPGSYRLSIIATDAAGNGSAPASASFTITR